MAKARDIKDANIPTLRRFGWFIGHVTLLFCTLRYGLSYITFNFYSRWAIFSYRTAFVAAAATYGIVVYKAYRARAKTGARGQNGLLSLVTDENVQYLGMFASSSNFQSRVMFCSARQTLLGRDDDQLVQYQGQS